MVYQIWLKLVNYEIIIKPEKVMQNFKQFRWNLCLTSLDLLIYSSLILFEVEF